MEFLKIGASVLFFPSADDVVAKANTNNEPIPGIVTKVWSNDLANITIFPDNFSPAARLSVARKTEGLEGMCFSDDIQGYQSEAEVVTVNAASGDNETVDNGAASEAVEETAGTGEATSTEETI